MILDNPIPATSPRYKLWAHMIDEHGLTLVPSEIDEILVLAQAVIEADESERAAHASS